ncbi:MAG: PA14 domain-containing protein [Chloroflexota bacterium]
MNDIVGIGGYLAVAAAALLLLVAGVLRNRQSPADNVRLVKGQSQSVPAAKTRQKATGADSSPGTLPPVEERDAPSTPPRADSATAPRADGGRPVRPDAQTLAGDRLSRSSTLQSVTALAAGVLLAGLSVLLAARLWALPADLGPLWWLLMAGAAFAVLAWARLGWPDADRYAGATIAGAGAENGQETLAGALVRVRSALIVMLAAVLVEVGSLALFWGGRLLSIAWLLHLLAAGVLVHAFWQSSRQIERSLVPGWSRTDSVWIAILTLAGLALRVWNIDSVPLGLWFDESQRGLEVLRMLAEPTYRPIFAAGILQEPTGLWYLMMPLISSLGRSPVALRLPVAIGGALGVAAVYVLARVMYGRRVAVAAAGLTVALAWHLNFSRIALPAILSLTCDTFAAAMFVGGLRRNSRFLLGTAGVVGGAGLYFYYTSQLMPFVLVLGAAQQVVANRLRSIRTLLIGLVVFGLGFLLAAGPFVFYAATNWERFSARAGTVSVFREVESAGSYDPLINNVRAHLLMFHVRGDPNGRHNWSGHPMLDAVTGGLAVLGLALAISRFWRLEQLVLLAWIPAALAGGIFSITWEAPQSHRAIGAIVPALMLAGLPLGLLWQRADQLLARVNVSARPALRQRGLQLGATAAVILVVCAADVANVNRFFTQQIQDPRTWMEFTTPQTEAGRQAAALPADMKVYLEPSWVGHPSIRFVDASSRQYAPYDAAIQLPITDSQAAIFIGERPGVAERVAALYPAAIRSYTRVPGNGNIAGYGFIVPHDLVQDTRGIVARYEGPAGAVEKREQSLSQSWPADAPVPPPFDVSWSTTLTLPTFNTYRLRLEGPNSLVLTLDGAEILRGGDEGAVRLARGNHALRITGSNLGREPVGLLWATQNDPLKPIPGNLLNAPPVHATGLLGRVYRGEDLTATPVTEQVDPNIELVVHTLPVARPYTLEWTGAVRAERDGRYRFGVGSLGTAAIWIDGTQVAVNATPGGSADGEMQLTRGWHDIQVRFLDTLGFSHVTAFWQPPDGQRQVIPTSVLRPWPAHRVVAARPEDGDLPAPTAPLTDESTVQVIPIVPPETAKDRREIGEGRILAPGGAVVQPRGLAVAADGTVYVADGGRKAIVQISPDGSTRVLGEGSLTEPSAVAVADGGLVVVDAGAGKVTRMSVDGAIGERLFEAYPLYGPRGISITPTGALILADTGNDRLLVRQPDGAVQVVPGLSQPTGGVQLGDGTFLAAEVGANRIVNIQADGTRIKTWAMPQAVTVNGPHVAMLPDGGWVVSLPDERAVMAHPAGASAATLWVLGGVKKPTGLAVGPAGLYVSDVDGASVRRFDLP